MTEPPSWRYTGREWVIPIPAGTPLLNANDRDHWAPHNRKAKTLRDIAWVEVKHQQLPRIQRAHIQLELRFPDKRRRDEANWAPTAKALVDGLVMARMLPDDDVTHVRGPDIIAYGPPDSKVVKLFPSKRPPVTCQLRIRELA